MGPDGFDNCVVAPPNVIPSIDGWSSSDPESESLEPPVSPILGVGIGPLCLLVQDHHKRKVRIGNEKYKNQITTLQGPVSSFFSLK